MLTNNKLLIDQDCAMCGIYAKFFVKSGCVDSTTIVFYQTVPDEVFNQIDKKRATSEVALYNLETGETTYGVASFITILGHRYPWIKRLFSWKIPLFLITKLYRFISFNRSVISGKVQRTTQRLCEPPVHLVYRWTYLILATLVAGFTMHQFSTILYASFGESPLFWQEYAVCFGQLIWQFLAMSLISSKKRLDYLGNMSTVSIIGSLLLIPLIIVSNFIELNTLFILIYFGFVVGSMFLLHLKRCASLKLPFITSISWILYRTLILIILLINLKPIL
jgi:hypothetical protein